MIDSLQNGLVFLLTVCFDLYITLLMVRFILCFVRADYFNPITKFIVLATKPIIHPLRKILPTIKNIELSTLVLMLLLSAIKFGLTSLITIGAPKNYLGLLILAIADVSRLLLNVMFWAIIIQTLMSLVQQSHYSPISRVLDQITAPILRPIQRALPPMGMFDLSPIPAIILLQLLIIVCITPLMMFGTHLTFGY